MHSFNAISNLVSAAEKQTRSVAPTADCLAAVTQVMSNVSLSPEMMQRVAFWTA